MSSPHSSTTRDALTLPSEGVRSLVSLLLIIHLFGVAVVLYSNASRSLTGDDPQRQANSLCQSLRVPFLVPYVQYLFQDEASNQRNYRLTHDEFIDLDYRVTFDLKLPDGKVEKVVFPAEGLWPGQRRQRMQALANKAGQRLVLEQTLPGEENVLPRILAQQLVNKYGAKSGTIVIRGHQVIEPNRVDGTDVALADPMNAAYYMTPYEATLLVQNGTVKLLKATAAGETAPSARGNRVPSLPSTPLEPAPQK